MGLLQEIQEAVISDQKEIGPLLYKLRFLASRLGNDPLEDWIRHELDGYPQDVDVPSYRIIGVSYTATFFGPFNSGVQNAPIPPALIEKFANDSWNNKKIRQSMSSIDKLVKDSSETGIIEISASNLILALQGKIYPDFSCNQVTGTISNASLVEIQNSVRSRILELVIQIESKIPQSIEIDVKNVKPKIPENQSEITSITNTIVYGDLNSMSNSGYNNRIEVKIEKGSRESLLGSLVRAGMPEDDARALVEIAESEQPEGPDEPLGNNAKKWLLDKLGKGSAAVWKMSTSTATTLVTEYLKKYYGL